MRNRSSVANAGVCAQTRYNGHIALFLLNADLRLTPQAARFAIPVGDPRMVRMIRSSASNYQVQSIGKNLKKI